MNSEFHFITSFENFPIRDDLRFSLVLKNGQSSDKYGPRGRGLGTRFSFRWNNQVAYKLVLQ